MQFSVDWYDIDLSGAIGQLGAQRIVNECNASASGSNLCQYVFRDPATNAVTAVRNPWLNINNARVRGLDYELLWNRDMDLFGNRAEAFTLRFLAGRLLEDSTTTPGGQPVDLAGQLNEPETRAVATLRYQLGEWGFSLQERYFGESRDQRRHDHVRAVRAGRRAECRAAPRSTTRPSTRRRYTDLTVTLRPRAQLTAAPGSWRWRSRTRIDEDPPVIPTFDQRFSSQTNPANAYDVYGRRFLASFRYRL